MALPPLDLHIPTSNATVQVSIINTTSHITNIPTDHFLLPKILGYDFIDCPAFSFLIQHSSGRKLLFDLGVRKDWENFAPTLHDKIKNSNWKVTVEKDVREILESERIDPGEISGIIWSHHHWDHTGDPSRFPKSTDLIVGPRFKETFMPGYPENPGALIKVSDYEGRTVHEINFSDKPLKIGSFPAHDFFGDGSFYLLDAPGHTIEHICGLARTSTGTDGDTFILMGGDFSHHGGEFRPSPYLPLPPSISPHPFVSRKSSGQACPGEAFEKIHPASKANAKDSGGNKSDAWRTEPFYRPGDSVTHDIEDCISTIKKVQEIDGQDQIFVAFAHDDTLMDVVDFFPTIANDWRRKGWARDSKWAFLKDFQEAVETGNS
ncbi:hypothetical protein MMC30_000386 [Trapelia coarctata]|nr:hypothetical protein [Trapelia coarctata]